MNKNPKTHLCIKFQHIRANNEQHRFYGGHRLIIIFIKYCLQCKAGRERITPYQSEDPSPIIPTHRIKEEKGKTVEDKKGVSS